MGPIVVLSPHSDDGVLSLGASMAKWARAGRAVRLLTVFALDPLSGATSGGWDRRAGFSTEAEAARSRRDEDQQACAALGVVPEWLPFGSVDYDRHGDGVEVWKAIERAVRGASVIFVPGSPLTHPDHSWLHGLMVDRLPASVLGLYAEQPYSLRAGDAPFARVDLGLRDRLAKWRAVRAYRSQLPLLGMRGGVLGRSALRVVRADERIALPDGRVDLPL